MIYDMSIGAFSALVAIGLFTVTTWVFVVRYKFRPWRSTPEGRTLMFMKICLATICTILFLFRFILDGPEWYELRSYIYTFIFLVMTWLMISFNKSLMKRNYERSDSDSTKD